MARSALLVAAIGTLVWVESAAFGSDGPEYSPQQIEFFEKHIRPLLAERCHKCHGPSKQKGGLRLDARASLLKGGDTGPAIVPGRPDDSELIRAVRYEPDGYQMPPDGKLPDDAITKLTEWVKMGAPWPGKHDTDAAPPDKSAAVFDFEQRAAHWSFQPLHRPSIPRVKQPEWCRTPVDHFLLSKLEEQGLAPASETDRRTWLRRISFDVTGLPPTPAEVDAFVNDPSPDAYATVVDRLLSSPHYGERWGRHWLDLVRYAESRGHEFDNDVANPWHYRDYVIRALNDDVPYDQFVVEHVAGDLLPSPSEPRALPSGPLPDGRGSDHALRLHPETGGNESILATGFWFLGEWVHSPVDIRQEEADRFENMIDVYSKTFLGLTVACARCHDHKFDPIRQQDFYALQGYLQSSIYRQARFETMEHNRRVAQKWEELQLSRVAHHEVMLPVADDESLETDLRPRDLVPDPAPLWRQQQSESSHDRFVEVQSLCETSVTFAGWWEPRLDITELRAVDSIPEPGATDSFLAGMRLRTPTFEIQSGKLHCLVRGGVDIYIAVDSHILIRGPLHGSLVQKQIAKDDAAWRWVTLDVSRYTGHRAHIEFGPRIGEQTAIARVVQSPDAPPAADLAAIQTESLVDLPRPDSEQLQLVSAVAPAMLDGTGEDEYVFIRGNWKKPGDVVPRRFLEVFGGERMPRPEQGSGRLELAQWMVDSEQTPILPRVIVNRIWQHYFGRGIVPTPDDFGHMGRPPSHPELLDWLASELVESGWSLKHIHRLILNSAAYRMASESEPRPLGRGPVAIARGSGDPDNRWLSRMNVKRLEGEIIRDAMLAVSGRLDDRMDGRSVPVHLTPFMEGRGRPETSGPVDGTGRRSLYIAVRRNFAEPFFQAFDMPNPHSTIGLRTVSNVPAQALALMNNPMVVEQSKLWAERLLRDQPTADADVRIRSAYRTAFSREPSADELTSAASFLAAQAQELNLAPDDPRVWADLCHVLFNAKEFVFVR